MKSVRNLIYCCPNKDQKIQRLKKDHDGPRSTCDMDQQITRTLPQQARVPRVIYRLQALNLCMSRESYGKLILQTSNLEFHVSGPVPNWNGMKLESHVNHVPVTFRRSNPSLHKTLPAAPSPRCSRWSVPWSPRVPCGRRKGCGMIPPWLSKIGKLVAVLCLCSCMHPKGG